MSAVSDGKARKEAVQAAMDVLAQAPMFAGLGGAGLSLVAEHARPVSFEAGETIYQEGGDSDSMLVLESGAVAICTDSAEVAELQGVDTVGEVGVVLGGPRMAKVVARSAVRGYTISKEGLVMVFLCNAALEQAVLLNIIAVLADRLGIANQKVAFARTRLTELLKIA